MHQGDDDEKSSQEAFDEVVGHGHDKAHSKLAVHCKLCHSCIDYAMIAQTGPVPMIIMQHSCLPITYCIPVI